LAGVLEQLEELWMEIGQQPCPRALLERAGGKQYEPRLLAKAASMAFFVLWFTLVAASVEDDVLATRSPVSNRPGSPEEHGAAAFRDHVTVKRVLGLTGMRPIHQRFLETERAMCVIFMARHLTTSKCFNAFRVIVRGPPEKREALKQAIEAVTYNELYTILPPFRQAKYQKASSSSAPVFKAKWVTLAICPGGQLAFATPPPDDRGCCNFTAPPCWTIEEPLDGPDIFAHRIVDHVLAGGSCSVEGCAGIGKIDVLKLLEQSLLAAGKRVAKTCLTHSGTRNIGK
jgi:hypothetical protein